MDTSFPVCSVEDVLGSGHFGTVHKSVWQIPGGSVEVAVKTLKEDASEDDRVKFLQEAAIMGQFLHPNVVKLHGVVTVGEPVGSISHTHIGGSPSVLAVIMST